MGGAVFKAFSDTPFFIFGNGNRLAFRKAAQNGKHQLTFHRPRVYIFLFKINGNAQVGQTSYHLQAIRCISGKSADGLGYDKLNLAILTIINHGKEVRHGHLS